MFNLGLPNDNRNCMTAADVIDPIVVAKGAKTLSHCFVQRVRSHLDGMLGAPQISARHDAVARCHE